MASRNASFHEGFVAGVVLAPAEVRPRASAGFVAILLFAWIVDWMIVFHVWPEGMDRLTSCWPSDLDRAMRSRGAAGLGAGRITGAANFLYDVMFEATGMHDMGMRFAEGAALSIPDTIVRNTYIANREAIEVAMVGTQLLGVRLAILAAHGCRCWHCSTLFRRPTG